MKSSFIRVFVPSILLFSQLTAGSLFRSSIEKKAMNPEEIKRVMSQVADWQMGSRYDREMWDWTQATYLTGLSAWAYMADDERYFEYLTAVGDSLCWKLGPRKYHADDHLIGWVYEELYGVTQKCSMIKPLAAQFDSILANQPDTPLTHDTWENKKRYNWCDALFMAPQVWIRLAEITGNSEYSDYAHKEFKATTEYLFDTEECLYFRDDRYFEQAEANGEKIFWSRGNGWVFGGLARLLSVLPVDDPNRGYYVNIFKKMAGRLIEIQPDDGLWRASLLDPDSYPVPETSGSAFYCFGLAWGINNGILNAETYLTPAVKAWAGLMDKVFPNGKLGYVQPIGADPKEVTEEMTAVYGTGGFLLAGSEMFKIALFKDIDYVPVNVQNEAAAFYPAETVEVAFEEAGLDAGKKWMVFDTKTNQFVVSQVLKIDGEKLLFQTDLAPGESRTFRLAKKEEGWQVPENKLKAHAMFVPQRKDDFAWENDRIAFRMYGPALQAQNEISSGIDVWVKSVRQPVLQKWYDRGDYHNNHGEGLDYYKVGPTLGCGGLGGGAADTLLASQNYTEWKILANGPVRTVFELTYAPWETGNGEVIETKRISLDLGSNLNRIESVFNNLPENQWAAGLVRRGHGGEVAYNRAEGWVTYWEPAHKQHGSIGVAILSGHQSAVNDTGDHLLISLHPKGKSIVYYSGACWEHGLDFKKNSSWNQYVKAFARRLETPVTITLIK